MYTSVSMTLHVLHTPPPTVMNFQSCNTSHTKVISHCVFQHLTLFKVAMPSLNWSYGDMAHLHHTVMAVWWHRQFTCVLWMEKSIVRWSTSRETCSYLVFL